MVHLGNDWDEILAGEFEQDYYKRIRYWLKKEYAEQTIYPAAENIFNALRYTPYSKVKAVILGQDPYHGPGQAHGLCFSVQPGVQPPPSLQNIFKELQSDLGIVPPKDGTLTKWAERGVLMLNTTLTVRRGQANSHKNLGWTTFTDHIIEKLNEHEQPIVFLLWGGNETHHRTAAPCARKRASLSSVGIQWLFRLQALLQMQCVSRSARHRPHRLGSQSLNRELPHHFPGAEVFLTFFKIPIDKQEFRLYI